MLGTPYITCGRKPAYFGNFFTTTPLHDQEFQTLITSLFEGTKVPMKRKLFQVFNFWYEKARKIREIVENRFLVSCLFQEL